MSYGDLREKTRIVDLKEEGASLDFLGYTFRYDLDLADSIQHSALKQFCQKFLVI